MDGVMRKVTPKVGIDYDERVTLPRRCYGSARAGPRAYPDSKSDVGALCAAPSFYADKRHCSISGASRFSVGRLKG